MKKRIAVVAGGDSGEYEISINSGNMVFEHLDRLLYDPWLIVMKGGEWTAVRTFSTDEEGKEALVEPHVGIDKNDFSLRWRGIKITFDRVFIAIHGTPGEDGKLQGYFDMMKIPYSTCNAFVSALTFNKHMCKMIVDSLGVPTARSVVLRKRSAYSAQKLLDELPLPLFVKPNNNGSSVGISKVKKEEELGPAIETAFSLDDEVIVESYMPGREITCAVFRDRGECIAFPITEIVSKKEFFDYEAKYSPGMAEEIVPAPIEVSEAADCTEKSLYLYEKLGCSGIVRFDYILDEGKCSFLEVNTVPGLSEASIVPKMAAAYGWAITRLFTRLIENIGC